MEDRKGSMARLAGWLHDHFLALLFASYAAAALWPGPGLAIRKLSIGSVGIGSIHTEASLPVLMLALSGVFSWSVKRRMSASRGLAASVAIATVIGAIFGFLYGQAAIRLPQVHAENEQRRQLAGEGLG